MGLDYVDIFYSHRVDENTLMEETVKALENLHFSAVELAAIDKHVADGQLNLWQASSDK